jgi:hypothetical protein
LVLLEDKLTATSGKSYLSNLQYFTYTNLVDVVFIKKGLSGNPVLKAGILSSLITFVSFTFPSIIFGHASYLFDKTPGRPPIIESIFITSIVTGGIGSAIAAISNEKNPRKLNFSVLSSKENFERMKSEMQKK